MKITPLTVSHAVVVRREEEKDIRDIVSLTRLPFRFDWLIKTPRSRDRVIGLGRSLRLPDHQPKPVPW